MMITPRHILRPRATILVWVCIALSFNAFSPAIVGASRMFLDKEGRNRLRQLRVNQGGRQLAESHGGGSGKIQSSFQGGDGGGGNQFEAALARALGGLPPTAASCQNLLEQYNSMLSWLELAPDKIGRKIPELMQREAAAITVDGVAANATGPSPQELASSVAAATKVAVAAVLLATSEELSSTDPARIRALGEILTHLNKVGRDRGFPSMRRLLVGAIVKMRVKNGAPFSPEVQVKVDKILTQLFELHRVSSAKRGAIQFIHVSKSGGTNLCMCAESNGCASESFDERNNCMVRDFGDFPRWVPRTQHNFIQRQAQISTNTPWFVNFGPRRRNEMSCEERASHLRKMDWNFYANEFTLPRGEEGVCRQFVNLMIVRDPIKRLGSQISWIQKLYKQLYNDTVDISMLFKGRTARFWEELVPAAVNNYYIRSLLGPSFFEAPISFINSTHIRKAMIEVLQHDLLMILEQKDLNEVVLQVGLGWEKSIEDERIRSSGDIKDEIKMPVNLDQLVRRNAPDVEVYRLAEQLQRLDIVMFGFASATEQIRGGMRQVQSRKTCGYVTRRAEGEGISAKSGVGVDNTSISASKRSRMNRRKD